LVSGRAAFVAEGTMATSSTANQSRGVQLRGSGTVLSTTDGTSATSSRTAKVVVPDGTDVLLELYASAGSSISSYRVLAADTTKLSYRTGGYYEQLTPVSLVRDQTTEATLTANAATEWPRVPGSGIYLEAGTYELIWNLYTVGWGAYWSVGCRVGAEQNQVIAGSANSNSWNRPVQTITVPSAQFVMPTVKAGSSSDLTIDAGRLNLFIYENLTSGRRRHNERPHPSGGWGLSSFWWVSTATGLEGRSSRRARADSHSTRRSSAQSTRRPIRAATCRPRSLVRS
uniref:hypothetical protein n=1 Tax=Rhodococcus hoagii TaxID=43767 RepID=UPI000AF4B8B1